MRIAFLTPEFATESYFAGGLAQYLGRLVPALVERGHDVEVFVTSEKEDEFSYHGAQVRRVLPHRLLSLRLVNGLLPFLGRRRFATAQQMCRIAKGLDHALRRRHSVSRFDIVQAASWMASGFFSVRRPVAPVVVRVSSYGPMLDAAAGVRITADRRIMWALELAAMRRAAAVYAPSRFLAHQISSEMQFPVRVVPPPFYIDTRAEDPSAAQTVAPFRPYLFFFGRVSRYKGAGLLAEAVRPLLAGLPDFHLVVAGPDGQDEAGRRLLALAHACPHRVHYLGTLPPQRLRPVIRAAHAVVLPSLADNLPNTCLEAMGLGQLVIGPDGVSFDELIADGESGLLFTLGSAASLRDAIVRVWRMPDEIRAQVGQRATARMDMLAPRRASAELESFYEQVLDKAARRPDSRTSGRSQGSA